MTALLVLACMAITVASYLAVRAVSSRWNHPLFNVVILSAALVLGLLFLCRIPVETYLDCKNILAAPLGPTTVALAVPLYRNRALLKRYAGAIFVSVTAGAVVSMATSGLLSEWGGLPRQVVFSMIPKGVTIPFAVELSRMYGGEPALTTAFVVGNGTLGAMFGIGVLNLSRLYDPVARGLAMGVVAHGQGTAVCFLEGERQGAMAGLAMTLAGVLTAALAPLVMPWFQ